MSETERIEALENHILKLEQENKRLHETVAYLTKKLFGRSSEKTSVLNLGGMSIMALEIKTKKRDHLRCVSNM